MDPEEIKRIASHISADIAPSRQAIAERASLGATVLSSAKSLFNTDLSIAKGFRPAVQNFAKDFLQGTVRDITGIGNSILGRQAGPVDPNSNAGRALTFATGKSEVPTMQSVGGEFLHTFGANDQVARTLGAPVGFGLGLLDADGAGSLFRSGSKEATQLLRSVAKKTATTEDATQIFRTLDESVQKLSYSDKLAAAHDLSQISDPKEAETYLKTLMDTKGAVMYNYAPEAAVSRISLLERGGAKLMENTSPEIADQSRALYRQLNSIARIAGEAGQGKSVLNEMVAGAEDLFTRLSKAVSATTDLPDSAVAKAVARATSKVTDPNVVKEGFMQTADARVAPNVEQPIKDGVVDAATENAPYDQMAADKLAQAHAGSFSRPLEGDALLADLGEHAPAVAEALDKMPPGSSLVRGLYGADAKDAAEKWMGNMAHGRNPDFGFFDGIGVRMADGSLKAAEDGAGKFFSESDIQQAILDGKKERGFITTVKESPYTAPEVVAQVKSLYDPITNEATLAEAEAVFKQGEDEALKVVNEAKEPTAKSVAVAQLLIEHYQQTGRIEQAVAMVEHVAERATSQGQAIQALSLWNRLTPAGILRHAQKTLEGAGKKLTPELGQKLVDMANALKKMDAGYEKTLETQKMLKLIAEQIPSTVGQKISIVQSMMLLLNPKTWLRNVIGNGGFAALEQVSDVFAAMIDTPVSIVTGRRTKVPPSVLTQVRGAVKGAERGWKEAIAGVNTIGAKTQYDIPQTGVFKGGVGKALETALNVELRVPDRMFYEAAHDGSIVNQLRAENITRARQGLEPLLEPTEEMHAIATHDALYRTFQDDSAIATALVGLKKVLNGGKHFGLGDVLIKFPKTPGNLLARGIDYSPAGFVKVLYEASRPLMKKEFRQKDFVEAFGRAITGSSTLVGTGFLMHQLGILSGKSDEGLSVDNANRANGLNNYQINVSALKRFVLSGMDAASAKMKKGDTMMTYDWFQPASTPIAIGANISQNKGLNAGSFLGQVADAVLKGADTLTQQPVLSNLDKFMTDSSYYGIFGAAARQLATLPASFVPTLLNQVRQLLDNDSRNTYSPDVFKYAENLARNRIPGLAETLPSRYSTFGDKEEIYQGGTNNPFNVLFNPLFVSHFKSDPAVNEVLDIYAQTGNQGAVPDLKRYKQKITTGTGANGKAITKDVQLGPKTYANFSELVGQETRKRLYTLSQNPEFNALPAEEKARYISSLLSDINTYGKIRVLGHRPASPPARVQQMLTESAPQP